MHTFLPHHKLLRILFIRNLKLLQLLEVHPRFHPNFSLVYFSLACCCIICLQSKIVHFTSNHLLSRLYQSTKLQKRVLHAFENIKLLLLFYGHLLNLLLYLRFIPPSDLTHNHMKKKKKRDIF
ncbi:hypothetical protein HanXRQr2_Chr01g0010511 [Helianthus annuus]|uniref:Uncharacterized protein n=1 Tax=Helianthus annuus TaxID=4232 RepID=A0A9K3JV08_HELAN|nr:hypothetical protein HanXRQr2_Chr01g0010511 [Helianthus annuus]